MTKTTVLWGVERKQGHYEVSGRDFHNKKINETEYLFFLVKLIF